MDLHRNLKMSPQRINAAKNWCFTLNNHRQQDIQRLKESIKLTNCVGLAFQEQVGEEKTPHLQGHIAFKTKIRPIKWFERILGHKRTHLEVRKGSIMENQLYCLDIEKRMPRGTSFNYGFKLPVVLVPRSIMREDQLAIADKFKEAENALHGRKIYWFWEEEGGWGKSFLIKYMVDEMGAYVVSGKNNDVLYAIAKMVKEEGGAPGIIIFDVPRVNAGNVSYQAMEAIKNGCFFNGKYEGGMVRFNSPHLMVFANQEPIAENLSEDRWEIKNLREMDGIVVVD